MSSWIRIGHGYDVHRLAPGLPLVIGGVRIEHHSGFVAHSDGDVLLHALCDALLGAAALGDIGKYFPDTDEKYRGADSMTLLRECVRLLREHHYVVSNTDATIIMQSPKLAPYIEQMRSNIAEALDVELEAVSVKATTEEGLGFTGREEGAAAHAVVFIGKNFE